MKIIIVATPSLYLQVQQNRLKYVLYTLELELVDADLDQNFSTAFLLLLKIIVVIVLTCFEFQYIDLEYCFIEQIHDGLPITDWYEQLRLLFTVFQQLSKSRSLIITGIDQITNVSFDHRN